MAAAFETGLETASTQVQGYITTALPVVAVVAGAMLAIKYTRRFIKSF